MGDALERTHRHAMIGPPAPALARLPERVRTCACSRVRMRVRTRERIMRGRARVEALPVRSKVGHQH